MRKFSRAEEKAYERSNAVAAIRVPQAGALTPRALAVADALATGDHRRVQAASPRLLDGFCELLRVPRLNVEVCGARPRNRYGELHGLYTPASGQQARDRVQVWMRTAQRLQVVAFKTFLRTLLHELCHHLDYEYLKLARSFHTEGFYRRESSLVYAVLRASNGGTAPTARAKPVAPAARAPGWFRRMVARPDDGPMTAPPRPPR
jgi:hypothetical protein